MPHNIAQPHLERDFPLGTVGLYKERRAHVVIHWHRHRDTHSTPSGLSLFGTCSTYSLSLSICLPRYFRPRSSKYLGYVWGMPMHSKLLILRETSGTGMRTFGLGP